MPYIRKEVEFTYYTGISTNPWTNDISSAKLYETKSDADADFVSSELVGIVTSFYQSS
mgnify:CR=1 FL=1